TAQLPDLVDLQTNGMLLPALEPLLGSPHLPDPFPYRHPHLSLLPYPYYLLHAESLLFPG
ncbi:MAG: hypothetical protein O7A06_02755, partial [Acidobacteria bacterium]|nr:hypothetical protein [Acidobacteriota bacterium]